MFWSNEIEYVQENIVRKYVDCRTALPTHSVVAADTAHTVRRTFVAQADTMVLGTRADEKKPM